ncbi:hypothetical protein LLS1_06030 [Leifsonia sp. LS1]|nr:hypothetical protein LLS1_06030 [Leifsonia sp. LS1]
MALDDGDVTWDEYEAAFKAYEACLARHGYELDQPHISGDLMDFGVPSAAVDSGVDDTCYAFNWAQVDQAWQIAHEDTSESAQIVAECLRSHGIVPSEKYTENLERLRGNGIQLGDCPADG